MSIMQRLPRIALLAVALFATAALAQETPDALVKRVSQDVLETARTDPKVQAGDQARIREVVESELLPYFDFERITALAMGRNWRQATPERPAAYWFDAYIKSADHFREAAAKAGADIFLSNHTSWDG